MSYPIGPPVKMQFNPDKNKQTIQDFFYQRLVIHHPVFFKGSEVAVKTVHKHLDMILRF